MICWRSKVVFAVPLKLSQLFSHAGLEEGRLKNNLTQSFFFLDNVETEPLRLAVSFMVVRTSFRKFFFDKKTVSSGQVTRSGQANHPIFFAIVLIPHWLR